MTLIFLSLQGRVNRWKDAVKHLEDGSISLGEQDDFFLKVWPEEKDQLRAPTTDPTTATPITTTDGATPVNQEDDYNKKILFSILSDNG